jgi:hypothetical protein
MPEITVPAGVPCPQTSTVTPVDRRLITEGNHPRIQGRTIELDERKIQTLTWALNEAQSAAFRTWWRDVLVFGGAWFSAPPTWPTPEGLVVKVRRFVEAPRWTYQGVGNWLVSATCEVRGATLLPVEPEVASGGIGWHEPVNAPGGYLTADPANEGTLTEAFFGGELYGGIWPWVEDGATYEFAVSEWEPVIPGSDPPTISVGLDGPGTFVISPAVVSFQVQFGVATITATRNGVAIPNRLQVAYTSPGEFLEVYANIEYLWFAN